MISPNKIIITKLFYDKELGNSRLELNIKGSDINHVVINTLRRTIFTNIPIYAYTNFKFTKNTSVFHNNYLKLHISNIPVWGLKNTYKSATQIQTMQSDNIQEDKMNEEDIEKLEDISLSNEIIDKNLGQSLDELTLYVNYKNKTNTIVSVTTDNGTFYYKNKQIVNPYKTPVQIVKLQPMQEIIFTAVTSPGIEDHDAIFSAVSINTYKEISENEYNFIIESRGQITEKEILDIAITNIIDMLNNYNELIKEYIKELNTKEATTNKYIIKIENIDLSIGNLMTHGYQSHKNIDFAGYNIEHPLDNKLKIHLKINGGNVLSITNDIVEYYKKVYLQIKTELQKLNFTETS